MKRNLTIGCDDSLEQINYQQPHTTKHQRTNTSPFSKTNKNFNLINVTSCTNTTQAIQFPKQQFQFKSPKYVGVIQKNVLQRLSYYDQKNKDWKQTQEVSTKIKEQQFAIKQLKQRPYINQISKELFQKRKKQRKLSPNVLQRFRTYQFERAERSAKYDILKANGMQIKNTTFQCRKNMNQQCRSRSPLKERTYNQSRSRSKSNNEFKKTMRNPCDIGKIVQRKQTQNFVSQKQPQIYTPVRIQQKQVYCSLISDQKQHFMKREQYPQQKVVSRQVFSKNTGQKTIFEKSQRQYKQLSPLQQKNISLLQKKKASPLQEKKTCQKSQKWKVIV